MPIIPRYGLRTWFAVAKEVWFDVDRKNFYLVAAGIAFYGLLALFPALAAIIAVWGLVGDPLEITVQMEAVRDVIPNDVYMLVDDQIRALASADRDTLTLAGVVSLAIALWLSRQGVAALMWAFNAIYGEKNRVGLRHIFTSLWLTLALIGVALVALLSVVVLPVVLAFVPLGPLSSIVVEVVRWLVSIFVLMAGAGLIYRYAPNRRNARMPWITPGAILAVALWALASAAFSYYLANFGNYNATYGSLGAVVAMLTWLFISGLVILIGGSLNAHLERHTHPDSTVGPDRPLGQRGAEVADTYIET